MSPSTAWRLLAGPGSTKQKWAAQLIPFLIQLGIMAGTGSGLAGTITSLIYSIFCLSLFLSVSILVSSSLSFLFRTNGTVHNRSPKANKFTSRSDWKKLDLLIAEKVVEGLCLFLEKKRCFYAYLSAIVRHAAGKLMHCAYIKSTRNYLSHGDAKLDILVTSLAGPLLMLYMTLLFGPCILKLWSNLFLLFK